MREIAFAIGLMMAVPAMAQSVGERSGVNAALEIAPTTIDFVKQAAMSDLFEIQSSQIASTKVSGQTKAFAVQMIRDHTKTSNELASLAQAAGIVVPTEMEAETQRAINNLNSLTGETFEKRYRYEQLKAHEDAVSLFERYANGGENPQLREWARATLPALEHHLEVIEKLSQ
jgi:putative membrane protein